MTTSRPKWMYAANGRQASPWSRHVLIYERAIPYSNNLGGVTAVGLNYAFKRFSIWCKYCFNYFSLVRALDRKPWVFVQKGPTTGMLHAPKKEEVADQVERSDRFSTAPILNFCVFKKKLYARIIFGTTFRDVIPFSFDFDSTLERQHITVSWSR